jgi:tetratricopeptide (TPR) repeat protein
VTKNGKTSGWQDAVIRDYARRMIKNPGSFAFVSMADSCIRAGRAKMALEVLDKGLRFHPELNAAHTQKGRALMALGRFSEAKRSLGYAIQNSAQNVLARKLLARLYLETGEPAKGMALLDEIRRLWPDHEPPQKLCGELRAAIEKEREERDGDYREEREQPDTGQREARETLERWLGNANKMMVRG